ncbi:MAG: radical SAM protein [Clostridia bacterium]|nr:radical SAM protein [Clostridia bacterium]
MFVHSFESMAARDGDGIRYCIFLSGCPLRCVYCHNPDTQKSGGKYYTPDEIAKKATRYKPYFSNGGGVTFSGGEPLLQADEIVKAGELLKKNGIGYILDTSLAVPLTDSVKNAIDNAEMILADLKFSSPDQMKRFTDGSLDRVMTCLDYITQTGKRMRVRTVVVPDINDSLEALKDYLPIIEKHDVEGWELLPFHTMGFFKYEESGIENPLKNTPAMDMSKLDALKEQLRELTKVKII